jgi:hypothetical protein
VDRDELEPSYMESVRLFNERARAERRRRWLEYHRHLAALHQSLADEHTQAAQKLEEMPA